MQLALLALCAAGVFGYPPPAGSYEVSSSSYSLGGFKCGKQEPTCNIYYPSELEKGPFPIATYGHGMGGEIIEDLVKSVASLGFVVVAPATSAGRCDDYHWKDMLHALEGSKEKVSLHKALEHVDWNRTAIFGHSMGGFATVLAAAEAVKDPEKYNVKAVVASHGYIGDATEAASTITLPAMFTTGTEDHRGAVKGQFDATPGRPKVLAQVQGADHMEPLEHGRLNPFDAHFLGCHVAGLQASCDKVYGTAADSMCQANKMTTCEIQKSLSPVQSTGSSLSLSTSGIVDYPPPAGSYDVSSDSYSLGGFKCGKQEPTCNIYYPSDLGKGPFPIATYGHGMGGEIIEDLVKSVASLGFVVVAPATSAGRCDDYHWKDMLHALEGSKEKVSLHRALEHVDWNRTAIFGHSMGGFATILAAAEAVKEPEKYNVKAVVASHGYIGDATQAASTITLPAMFTTGTEDHCGAVKGQFDATPGRPKVLAQVQGAEHMEPLEHGRLNPFDAHFLGCHVAGLQASCDKIYGAAADSICKANEMTTCEIEKGLSLISSIVLV